MAVNSFVENVNKLATSLYGDRTTPLDVSIITNNIEAITFLYNYISNGGEFGTIGASTVIENVDILPSVSTEGTIVYLNTNNKLYVYNGASWDEVGGGTIESTGGSITVVGTKPVSATLGDIIYLTTDGFLYTWDGSEWDKVGGTTTTTTSNTGIFVKEKPTNPNIGDVTLNIIGGSVDTWDGTQWVTEKYTPHASSMTSIKFVTALPLAIDSKEGDLVYNKTDGITYIFKNGAWVNLLKDLTPNASGTGIEIVAILPITVTNGKVVYNSADKKLYEGVNGAWVAVVQATTAATDVADASITVAKFAAGIRPVETLSVLPTTGNSIGRMVYLTTDGQLYRYTASGFTTAVPAQALAGTITSTQIADDAITTPKIATGAITADEIGANAITAGKIAANAVTAGTIQAGAISATEIASNAITTDKIYSGAITAVKLSANSVDATKIVAGSIGASLIAADAINAGHIRAGAVGASEISAGAITADKIASKSITATQIQAGAISSSEIASNAITADKILAGAITADKIASKSITATQIQAGAISSSEIASNAITADKILAGAITASKLSVDSLTGTKGLFTSSNPVAGSMGEALAAIQSNGSWCLSGRNDTGSGDAVGVAGNSTNSANGVGVYGVGAYGVVGVSRTGQLGFFTNNKCYAAGGFTPFTGAHIVYAKDKTLKVGMTVASSDAWCINISQTLIHIEKASLKAKNVVGVVSAVKSTLMDNITNNPMIKEEHQPYIDYMKTNGFFEVEINSVGEGGIFVSNINGNIDNGDYLMSDGTGSAMKQDDDILHNYTVAKALESVDWSKESATTKLISCTYHAG